MSVNEGNHGLKFKATPWTNANTPTHTCKHTHAHTHKQTNTPTQTHICNYHIHLQDHDLVLGGLPHFPAIFLEELLAHVDLVCLSVLGQTQLAKLFTERHSRDTANENFWIDSLKSSRAPIQMTSAKSINNQTHTQDVQAYIVEALS